MTDLREALESAITQNEAKDSAAVPSDPAVGVPDSVGAAESVAESNTESVEVAPSPAADAPAADAPAADAPSPPAADAPSPPAADAPAADAPAADAAAKLASRVERAPSSWKKEAKEGWDKLPLQVRQEIHRRENQINQVLTENSRNKEVVEALNQVVTPYMARLKSMGGAIPAIERLLQAEYTLATGNKQQTARMMAQLISDYGVDITELDAVLSGQVSKQPDIGAIVQQHVQQALAPIYQEKQQSAERTKREAEATIEEMALDPKYPYFDEVRDDMADLIELKAKKGLYLSLEEAYNTAIQMNPNTRGQLQRQAVVQTATQQHQQAQRAKAAGSSVTGAPASGGSVTLQGDGTLRGAIEAAFGGQRL